MAHAEFSGDDTPSTSLPASLLPSDLPVAGSESTTAPAVVAMSTAIDAASHPVSDAASHPASDATRAASERRAGVTGGVRNVADLVRRAAISAGSRTALIAGTHKPTWRELDRQVDALATGLAGLGLQAGDRVALVLGTDLPYVVAWYAVLRANLVAVPVNPSYTAPELTHQVRDSGARAVLTDHEVPGAFDSAEHVVLVGSAAWSALAEPANGPDGTPPPAPVTTSGDDDLAALVYTSGTSGQPRGAMLSHRALLANLDQVGAIDPPPVLGTDVVLLVLPLFHIYGLNAGLNAVAAFAATGVLAHRFDPVDCLTLITEAKVTAVIGAPTMYIAWAMLPATGPAFARVRLATSGAAPLPADVLARMSALTGRPVYEGYGLTETGPVLTLSLLADTVKPGSVGRPVPGVELRLLDEDGEEVDEEDHGEVTVRGPNLFSGYWPDGHDGPDADGWFATGDIAFRDADGDLHLVDRRRDLILVSGFNVYPREVEEVIASHPDVAEVAVVGVPHPYTGESVKALVVAVEGRHPTAADITAYTARSLARFKCPTVVSFVTALPRSGTGKVSRANLRAEGQ